MRCRSSLALVAVAAVAALCAPVTWGQSYPTKPVRLVVGYAPGGGADNIARLLSASASDILGQQIVVDNRAGANGVIAAELVAKSPRDGYTIHVVTSSHVTNPSVHAKLSYDTAGDFSAVTELADTPLVMVVNPSMKTANVAEFISVAKAQSLNYASAGLGNMTQVAAELFNLTAGVKMMHVPYKGSGPAIVDLLGGRVAVYFPPVPSAMSHIQSGRLRPLAVTSAKRALTVPTVPTMAESGLAGFEAGSWYGVIVPAGVPAPIVRQLHAVSVKALQTPVMQDRMKAQGLEAVGSTPGEFDAKIRRDIVKWRKVFKEANIVMQ